MKIILSIPDNVCKEAETTARQLGLTRDQLYIRAVKEFVAHHQRDTITEMLDGIYADNPQEDPVSDSGIDAMREAAKNDHWIPQPD